MIRVLYITAQPTSTAPSYESPHDRHQAMLAQHRETKNARRELHNARRTARFRRGCPANQLV